MDSVFSSFHLSRERYKEIIYIFLIVSYLGLSILIFPLKYIFLAILCFLLGLIIFHRFEWALFFTIGFMPVTRFPGITEYVQPFQYLLLILVLLSWFTKKILSEDKRGFIKDNPYNLFIILFGLLILVTSISSIEPGLTVKAAITHFVIFGYLYLFLDIFRSEYYMKRAVYLLILSAVFVSSIAILQYLVVQFKILTGLQRFLLPPVHRQFVSYGYGYQSLFTMGGYRSVGTFYHPNLLGIYLAMIFPFTISLLFYLKERRIIFALSALTILAGLFCSGSRGGFLNLLVSNVILFVAYRKRVPVRIIFIFLLLLISIVVVFSQQLIPYFRLIEGISFRDIIWNNTLEIIRHNPLLGTGLGTFSLNYIRKFGFPSVIDLETILDEIAIVGSSESMVGFTAHNLFLNYAAEMGLFAAILMLFFYLVYIKKAFNVFFKKNNYNFNYAIFIGTTASIIGNFAHTFFEASINFNYFSIGIIFILILSMGIIFMLNYAR
jgi:putative inorganic carbon (HCO3(-)) transporter